MKNLITRALSGIVYVGLILGAIFAGTPYVAGLMSVFAFFAILELHHMMQPKSKSRAHVAAMVIDIIFAVLLPAFGLIDGSYIVETICFILFLAYIPSRLFLTVFDLSGEALRSVAASFFSVFYLSFGLCSIIILQASCPPEKPLLLATFVMIWLNDTGAYLVGCRFGKRRLCERLSPKKSWEGFWGGMVFSILVGVVFGLLFPSGSMIWWIAMGIIVSIAGTIGDLLESLIKRTYGVKDSGHLIPGHGGILDRIDSVLLAAPTVLVMDFIVRLLSNLFSH